MLYTKELVEEVKQKIGLLEDTVLKIDDDKDWTFDVIATTADRDRDNEEIKVNGWDTKNWMKSPVILANHNYTIENIVGKGLKFYTSKGVKRLKGVFSKTNPLGVLARNLYNEGMLKSVSVGFIPLQRNANDYKIIEKAELLEVSFVAVPCNPNAISLDGKLYDEAVQKGLIKAVDEEQEEKEEMIEDKVDLKELAADIKEIKSFIKSLADDKAEQDEIDMKQQELLAKKQALQSIDRAVGEALKNMKHL